MQQLDRVPEVSLLNVHVSCAAARYDKAVVEEQELSPEKRIVANVGKMDAKKHLAANVNTLMTNNINQAMGTMLDTVVF
jgi:26S proteasome regulatory subunit N11